MIIAPRPTEMSHEMTLLPDHFDALYRGRRFWRSPDRNGEVSNLFDWSDLNQLLDLSPHVVDAVKIVKDGENLDPATYLRAPDRGPGSARQVIPEAVARALREGYSIVLNYLPAYHAGVRALCEGLTEDLAETVNVNGYASWSETQCFPVHWDSHDVIIIQTAGRKHWTVYRPTREHPVETDAAYHDASSGFVEEWSGVLEAGQRLYIPRGWWHKASARPGGSIHLTCGFTNKTGLSLIRFLSDLAARDPALRADLPSPDAVEATQAYMGTFRAKILELLDNDFVDRFWSAHCCALATRRRNALPQTIDADRFDAHAHTYACTAFKPQLSTDRTGEEMTLLMGGRALVFDQSCEPALRVAVSGQPVTTAAIKDASGWDESTIAAFVFELVGEGVLCIEETRSNTHAEAAE